jgi:hypothetical protein
MHKNLRFGFYVLKLKRNPLIFHQDFGDCEMKRNFWVQMEDAIRQVNRVFSDMTLRDVQLKGHNVRKKA